MLYSDVVALNRKAPEVVVVLLESSHLDIARDILPQTSDLCLLSCFKIFINNGNVQYVVKHAASPRKPFCSKSLETLSKN